MKNATDNRRRRTRGSLFRSDRGSVAVETALVIPMMLMILLGFSEMYLYLRAVSLVEHTAFMLADSLGQKNQVINNSSTSNDNNLGAIWNDATLLAAPNLLSTEGGVVITSVCDVTTTPCGSATPNKTSMVKGTPSIYWQAKAPWNTGAMASQVSGSNVLPSTWPFREGDSAIVVEVFYYYNPFSMLQTLWSSAPGVQKIYRRVYVRPRANTPLPLVAG